MVTMMPQIIKLGETPISTVVAALIVILLATIYYLIKNRNILPGPKGVPYLGLLPFLKDDTVHLQLTDYGKKYGDTFSFTIGGELFINIGSVKALRELHVTKSDCFEERFNAFHILQAFLEDGLFVLNGEACKTQKKFFTLKLREYGINQTGPSSDCIESTMKLLVKRQNESVNIVQLLTNQCTVHLRTMLFGDNGITDEEMNAVNENYLKAMESLIGVNMLLTGSFGRIFCRMSSAFQRSMKIMRIVLTNLETCVTRIETNMSENSPTCIVEEFFNERNKKRKQNDPSWKSFTKKSLISTLAQIAGDGIGTVASFIAGFLNAVVEYPDEAEKMYQEIMDVVGSNRQPTLADKANLPYTNAFVYEVLRLNDILQLFLSLECTKETSYLGYRIPKRAITLYNFYAIHRNPCTYKDPETFNPSRFIPAPGKPKEELPVLFGMGKRACTGEAFVMAQAFLFLTTIVKNFKIVSSKNSKVSNTILLLTGQLELQFKLRPGAEI